MVTESQLETAMRQHHEAKKLADRAEELQDEARSVILDYFLNQVVPKSNPEGTFTVTRGGLATKITFPKGRKIPGRVKPEKVEEFRRALVDEFGDEFELFKHSVDYDRLKLALSESTSSPEVVRWMANYLNDPEVWEKEVEGAAGSARVSTKKAGTSEPED